MIEIERIRRAVERWGARFLQRVYTPGELADCGWAAGAGGQPVYQSLAARWAAKEATAKALGLGLRGPGAGPTSDRVALLEIEVVRGAAGQPTLQLLGLAAERAAALGIAQLALSLSHSRDYALASVVATGEP